MKHKFGSKALSLLLSVVMVVSMFPAMTLTAGAAENPNVSVPGSGYYPQKWWDTALYGTDHEPEAADYGTKEYWLKRLGVDEVSIQYLTQESLEKANWTVKTGTYFIQEDISHYPLLVENGLTISGDVTLILLKKTDGDYPTLTFKGGSNGSSGSMPLYYDYDNGRYAAGGWNGGSGGSGAGAGIEVSGSSMLRIMGGGTVNATGGPAGSGNQSILVTSAGKDWYATGGSGGGGGAGAGIGGRGGNGGKGGNGGYHNDTAQGIIAPGKNGASGSNGAAGGSLYISGSVTVIATGGSSNMGGYQPHSKNSYYPGSGGGGGGGGSAYAIGSGGYGGGGGGGGSYAKSSAKMYGGHGGGGGGGSDYSSSGYYPHGYGAGGLGSQSSTYFKGVNGSSGNSGPGASGGKGGTGVVKTYNGGDGGNAGKYGASSASLYYAAGENISTRIQNKAQGGKNYETWPLDECKIEVVAKATTGFDAANNAWIYTGSEITPGIKITHIPTGETKTLSASDLTYKNNIYGGYGEITVKGSSSFRLVKTISSGEVTNFATVKLYFPIKTTVEFDSNATTPIAELQKNGVTGVSVVGKQDAKLLQIDVTDTTEEVLSKAAALSLDGYDFLGWYYLDNDSYFNRDGSVSYDNAFDSSGNPKGVQVYDASGNLVTGCSLINGGKWHGVTSDGKAVTRLYAMWKQSLLTLYLNARGGTNGGNYPGQVFGSYYQIPAPTKNGYTFGGYYTSTDFKDDELVCKLDENGEMVYRYVDADGNVKFGKNSDGSKDSVGLKLTHNTTLYAKWDALLYDIQLYDGEDIVGTLKDVQSGHLLLPNIGAPVGFTMDDEGHGKLELESGKQTLDISRDHYDFVGWNIYEEQDWATHTVGHVIKTTLGSETQKTVRLYAAWKIKDNYHVTYDGRGGQLGTIGTTDEESTVFKGETYHVTTKIPTRTGYTFAGWNTTPDGNGTAYASGAEIENVQEAIYLYAQWTENNSVVYHPNADKNNMDLSTEKPAKGDTVTVKFPNADSDLTRTGYTFAGWATTPDATEAEFTKGGTENFKMGDESVNLYAVWKPVQVAIEYKAEDGQEGYFTWGDKPESFTYGTEVTFTIKVDTTKAGANTLHVSVNGVAKSVGQPTVDGDTYTYTFKVGGNVTDKQTVTVGGLTARSYNVSLNLGQGGTIETDKNVTYYVYGMGKDLPTDGMAKKGYTFAGWYNNEDYTGTAVTSISSAESGDKIFYAKWTANTYTVKYDGNGASGQPGDGTATYDQPYTIADGSTMTYGTGVDFLGWSTDPDAVRPEYKAGDKVLNLATGENDDKEITLYAVWKVPTYTINYVLMGGTADGSATMDPLEVKTGTDAALAFPTMVRSGYSFMGWDTNKDASDPIYTENGTTSITTVTGNVTLYAIWKPITYSIVFHNGNDADAATYRQEPLSYGERRYQLTALSEMNFTAPEGKENFLGWSATPSATTPQYLDGQNIRNLCDTQDGTYDLYAVWGTEAVKYLSYDANGGTWTQHAPDAVASENEDGTVDVQFDNLPKMEGYDFAGWWLSDDRTITAVSDNKTVDLTSGNVTLYATWEAHKYTVTYNANGGKGTMESQGIAYDASASLSANAFTRDGYKFLGWSENPYATAPTYQDQQSVLNLPVVDGKITLYAVWQQEDPIYITYNANGGSGAPATDSTAKNAAVTISNQEPAREGYTFLGWATTSNATLVTYAKGAEVEGGFSESTTLYAVWQLKQTRKVIYDADGGYGSFPVDSNSYYEGDTVHVRFDLIPAKSGYTFAGWKNGNTVYNNRDGETFLMADADVTLIAQWTANRYTVKFNAGSGSGSMTDLPMTYGTAQNLTANGFTAPTGYSFAGWAVAPNGGVTYEDQASVKDLTSEADGEVTLYAVWKPLTVKVTLNPEGGEGGTKDVTVTYDQQMPSANPPSREGYTFGGYYTEQNGGGTQYYDAAMNSVRKAQFAADTELHAKWTPRRYSVTYMNGTESVDTVTKNYGDETTIRGAAGMTIAEGKKLVGWSKTNGGAADYHVGDTVDLWTVGNGRDVVLYAVIKKDVTYTVTYDAHGGTGREPVDTNHYDEGAKVTVLFPEEGAIRDQGYEFLGWSENRGAAQATYTNDEHGQKEFIISKDTTLYAVWDYGTYTVKYIGGDGSTLKAGAHDTTDVTMRQARYYHQDAIFTKPGYTLLGWATTKDKADKGQFNYSLGELIDTDLTSKSRTTVSLYTVWEANKYTVSFNGNGEGAAVSEQQREVTFGQKYGSAFPIPTREGYVFDGWYTSTSPSDGDTAVTNMTVVTNPGNHTLYAKWNAVQYSITTKDNGVGTIALTNADGESITNTADAGTEITVTVAPRDNYTIDNVTLYVNGTPVSMEGEGRNTYTFTLNRNTEVALKANGNTGAKYTVKYDKNAEDASGDITSGSFIVGQSATLSDGSGFTRTGYNLTGWNTKANGNGTSYGLGTEQTTALTQTAGGTVTLYAQWSATNCTVNFDAKGGTVTESSKDVTFGKAYGTLPTPTMDGSVFDGWYLDENCKGEKVTSSTIVANANAHTLYAKWVSAQYTVTVNDNGVGTITLNGVDETNKAAAGTQITVAVTPRENYTIDNVKLYVNGSPVSMTGSDKNTYKFTISKNTTVALEENSNIGIKYTVGYNANGGTGTINAVEAVSGKTFLLAAGGFTKDGSTLEGWNTMADGSGHSYKKGERVKDLTLTPGETVTLYAQWTETDPEGYTYTIRYEANGGKGAAYEQTMHQNRLNVALYDGAGFSRAGYALVGWTTAPTGTVIYQLGDTLTKPLASQAGVTVKLYAVWEKDAIRVTLVDDQNVNTVPSLVLKTGATYGKLPVLSKPGYDFDGWYTEKVGGIRVDNNTEVTATADHTLYAHWTEKASKTYTVTVQNSDLGTVRLTPAGGKYAPGAVITVTVSPAEGKTVKLISSVDGEITLTENTGKFTVTKDTVLTLVEVTNPDPDHPEDTAWYLFFNGNGGTGSMAMQTVTSGNPKAPASIFTREGYNFTGWKDGNGKAYAVGDEIAKPENGKVITLYAQWEATAENTFTVTFDAQGGTMNESTTRTYHAGDKYGILPEPIKSGDWNFAGWYSDSALTNRVYATTEVSAKNHTLYAKWVSLTNIVVTATGYANEYDGNSHALTVTLNKSLVSATYQWFKDGNPINGASSRVYYVKNVADSGNYTCVVSGSYNGVEYKNLESTTAVVSILRKELTVTAGNASVFYGSNAPAYALSYSGFAVTDDASVLKGTAKANCTYVKGNDASEYDITVDVSGLTADNYKFKTANGKLTVKQLPVSLDWSATKLKETGSEQTITATVKNKIGNDTFTLAYTGNTGTAVGNYSAKVTGLGNSNYTLDGATGVKHNWVIYEQGKKPGEVPDPVQPGEPEKAVTGIELNPTSKTLNVNEEFTLTYTLQPAGATSTVTFTSSNNSIASVDNNGKVTAKASGTAVITATTANGLTATCTVTVKAQSPEGPIHVTGITIRYTSYKMTAAGQTFNVGATVKPANADNKTILYSSSNRAVATVDATGKVTAVSSGTATITATTDDGGYTVICTVTVEIGGSGSGGSGSGGSGSGGTSGGSTGGGSTGGGSTGGSSTTNPSTGADISKGGVGNTAYSSCKHDSKCPIYPFKDAFTDAWYHDGVHYCIDNGLMGGYGDGLFGPNDKITRAQIVMILWRIAGSPVANYAMNFTDVTEDAWYAEAIRWATSVGVASGYGEGKFGPNDSITREQFAAMLYRFAQLQGKDVSRGSNTLNGFTDVDSISDYALTAMQWANGMGIISGTDNNTLMPKGNATRAQAACMIQRYIINLTK